MPEGDALRRFAASMPMDYEKWHDGLGYDLDALRAATPGERAEIERLVLAHAPRDGRDVEALAELGALGSTAAREALRAAAHDRDPGVRMAVARHAPEVLDGAERTASLLAALRTADFYGGLTQALDEAAEFHPPEVVEALRDGALARSGEVAVHFAALLAYLAGKAAEPFDMAMRPLFLRFATEDRREREAAWRDLCALTGEDPEPALARRSAS